MIQKTSSRMVRNTISNYIRTAVAMAVGLVTFRLLYQEFDPAEFGFWSLLWSLFGYGILLDFGFGFAAQKRVAELSVTENWAELSCVLSSILVFYSGVALLVGGIAFVGSPWIIQCFGVPLERSEEFRQVFVVFFAGIGLAFPMGIFPEILRGQQRISLANWITTAALLARLAFIMAALHWHWSFLSIMIIALASTLVPDVLAGFLALQRLPQVKLRFAYFRFSSMGETAKFSLFAYLGTATNLLLAKTDQLVLTTTLGVGSIVLYQSGAKVAEVFREFTKQLQDTLSPAAAHLHASGHTRALRDLLVNATRWSVIIATPLYLLCAFYLETLLQMLTGDRSLSHETWLVGQVLLFWYFTTVMTHSVSKRIFMMTGHERKLMRLGMAEAVVNLGLSIVLVIWLRSVVAVALGSLLATLWFGWGALWKWQAQEVAMRYFDLFRQTIWPAWLGCLPAVAALVFMKLTMPSQGFWGMCLQAIIAGSIALWGIWKVALIPSERVQLLARFQSQPIPVI